MSALSMLPSSDTKAYTLRKFAPRLATEMPCRCTSCGSRGVASWSLFWTCTCAMSGLASALKVRVISACPEESLVEDMYSR